MLLPDRDFSQMARIASEDNLVKKAAKGDTEAFALLYERYIDPIFRYIYFRVDDVRDAEDLTENVFIKVWEALPNYKLNGFPLSSWLYRIAHNAVIDFHRKKIALPMDDEDWNSFSENQVNILADIENREQVRELIKAITLLPEDHQQVIVLRFIEGLSHKEIAQIIGKNDGACRMIQHRALEELHKILKDGYTTREVTEDEKD